MASKALGKPGKSKIVAVISDLHFPGVCRKSWAAFRQWHSFVRPHMTVVLGDFLDLESLSSFSLRADAPMAIKPQIEEWVQEANALAVEAQRVVIVEGNHEHRYARKVLEPLGHQLLGLDLSLKDISYRHGLSNKIEWTREGIRSRGVRVGQYLLRHGDKQARGFGAEHVASAALKRDMGQDQVIGHHHKCQHIAVTGTDGHVHSAIANPCLEGHAHWNPNDNWVRGFTVLELYGHRATGYPIYMENGKFGWAGRSFG